MIAFSRAGRHWLILGLLMAVGLAARLINSGSGLWFDEVVTLVKYVRSPVSELLTACTDFNNHMLFTLAAKASVAVFGESPWVLRLPAVLFGVAGIPAIWWFTTRILGRREALLAAALLSVAYHHVWFSQNARGYTGLLLFEVLGTALFIEGMRGPEARTWIAYGVVSALAIWTHLTAGFAIAAQGLVWLFVVARSRLARGRARSSPHPAARSLWPLAGFAIAGVVGVLLYVAILPQMLQQFDRQAGIASVNVKVREWTSPLWTIQEAIRQSGLGAGGIAALVVAAGLALVGFVSLARLDPLAAAVMVLPGPVALAVLKAASFHIWPRYFFPLFGFAVVFLVHGIWVVALKLGGRFGPRAAVAGVVLAAVASIFMLVPNWKLPKQDFEGARDFVTASRGFGEPVVTAGLAAIPYSWLYAPDWLTIEDVSELDGLAASAPGTWLVYSFPTVLKASHPEVFERVRTGFETVREFPGTVGDGTVYVARSRQP